MGSTPGEGTPRAAQAAFASACAGFGLIDTLAALAVLAIVAGLGAPALAAFVARERAVAAAAALVHTLAAARAEALRRAGPISVCRSPAPGAGPPRCASEGDWSAGWLIVAGTGEENASPLRVHGLDARTVAVSFRAPVSARLTFGADGQPAGNFAGGTFRICPTGHPEHGRSVVVSRAGRPRVAAEACA